MLFLCFPSATGRCELSQGTAGGGDQASQEGGLSLDLASCWQGWKGDSTIAVLQEKLETWPLLPYVMAVAVMMSSHKCLIVVPHI